MMGSIIKKSGMDSHTLLLGGSCYGSMYKNVQNIAHFELIAPTHESG
jgi:hypothetical protein